MKTVHNYSVKEVSTLKQLYCESRDTYGTKTFLKEKVEGAWIEYGFKKFADDIEALGTALLARGLADQRILLLGDNCYAWAISYMAVVCGVGVVIPVNKDSSVESLQSIVDRTDAKAVIASPACLETVHALRTPLQAISFAEIPTLITEGNDRIIAGDRAFLDAPIDPDEMRILVFTAGSNGISKGVMLSHRNICFNLSEMCQMVHLDENDQYLSVLPLHHVYECTCGLLVPLYRGAGVAFCEGLRHLMRDLREIQPTVMLCVPMLIETIYRKIWSTIRRQELEKKVKNSIRLTNALPEGKLRNAAKRRIFAKIHETFGGKLRLLLTGGAPADPDVLKGLRDFGICAYQNYSLSECGPLAAMNRDTYYRDASAGMALPDSLLDIYDMQDDGIGEIRYKAPNVMLGYFDMPEKSARAIRDGWFYTGDLGTLDADGFLYIVGGKKNVITTLGGKNVFPEELEALLQKTPYVKEAAVVGKVDPETQEAHITAILYPDVPALETSFGKTFSNARLEIEMKKALATVNAAVQPYKHIHTYILSKEELPKHSSRKLDRLKVKEMV